MERSRQLIDGRHTARELEGTPSAVGCSPGSVGSPCFSASSFCSHWGFPMAGSGEAPRTAIGAVGSAARSGSASGSTSRKAATDAALACVATGIAGPVRDHHGRGAGVLARPAAAGGSSRRRRRRRRNRARSALGVARHRRAGHPRRRWARRCSRTSRATAAPWRPCSSRSRSPPACCSGSAGTGSRWPRSRSRRLSGSPT